MYSCSVKEGSIVFVYSCRLSLCFFLCPHYCFLTWIVEIAYDLLVFLEGGSVCILLKEWKVLIILC